MQIEEICVRGIVFGKGMPKICVPLVGKTDTEILNQALEVSLQKPDCIEFRADWYENVLCPEDVERILGQIREMIGNIVLLFTFRSKEEGGQRSISVDQYSRLCENACESGYIDLLDVEAFKQNGLLEELAETAHKNGVYIVGSNHDFVRTADEDELLEKLQRIDEMGADIPKIAVMPVTERDVLNLLSATLKYHEKGGNKPVITMSMKPMGGVSRLAGELVGSVMTFATLGQESAPGQIPLALVRDVLKCLEA